MARFYPARSWENPAAPVDQFVTAVLISDELYYSIRPMLAVSGGRLVCLSTPFGKRGFFFEEWQNGQNWERIKITAHDCTRITDDCLHEEQQALGSHWYRQEYLCEFLETEDQVFGYDLIANAFSSDIKPLYAGV